MTAEEVVNKISQKYGWLNFDVVLRQLKGGIAFRDDVHKIVKEAMGKCAKQEAIGFQNWIDKKGYYKMTISDKFWYKDDGFDGASIIAKSIEELYEEYELYKKENV